MNSECIIHPPKTPETGYVVFRGIDQTRIVIEIQNLIQVEGGFAINNLGVVVHTSWENEN